jgi:ATP-binding cassette subfamily B protein
MRRQKSAAADRPTTRDLRPSLRLLGFVRPYRFGLLAAVAALFAAAGVVLAFGQLFREIVDSGLKSGSPAALDQALLFFLALVLVLGTSMHLRTYQLNWLGEREIADLRQAVFGRVLKLDVGFRHHQSRGGLSPD